MELLRRTNELVVAHGDRSDALARSLRCAAADWAAATHELKGPHAWCAPREGKNARGGRAFPPLGWALTPHIHGTRALDTYASA